MKRQRILRFAYNCLPTTCISFTWNISYLATYGISNKTLDFSLKFFMIRGPGFDLMLTSKGNVTMTTVLSCNYTVNISYLVSTDFLLFSMDFIWWRLRLIRVPRNHILVIAFSDVLDLAEGYNHLKPFIICTWINIAFSKQKTITVVLLIYTSIWPKYRVHVQTIYIISFMNKKKFIIQFEIDCWPYQFYTFWCL